MAHKKAGSSSKNGRDSVGQRLGCKAGDGQFVTAGSIIVRQARHDVQGRLDAGLGHDYTPSSRRSTGPCTTSTRLAPKSESASSPWRASSPRDKSCGRLPPTAYRTTTGGDRSEGAPGE